MKLCINCKHENGEPHYPKCFKSEYTNPVTGTKRLQPCFQFRTFTMNDYCGPDAKFFEAKEE